MLCAAVILAVSLSGCDPDGQGSFVDIVSDLYAISSSHSVSVHSSDWYYRHRYEFHYTAWAGVPNLDLGSPGFTLLDLSSKGLYIDPVTSVSNAGKLVSVTALLGHQSAAGTGALFIDPVEPNLPGWDYNTVYPGIVDGMLFRQVGSLPDGSGGKILATAYAWIAGLSPCYADALKYLSDHPDTDALWRLTAMYSSYDLMPSGFLVEFQALDGGLSFCKYVYNVQPGIAFDYATARNWVEAAGDPVPQDDATQEG